VIEQLRTAATFVRGFEKRCLPALGGARTKTQACRVPIQARPQASRRESSQQQQRPRMSRVGTSDPDFRIAFAGCIIDCCQTSIGGGLKSAGSFRASPSAFVP
jgi:hypothetical protein